jgi:hypothetical protein
MSKYAIKYNVDGVEEAAYLHTTFASYYDSAALPPATISRGKASMNRVDS